MVQFERLPPSPIDRVWQFLTDTTRAYTWNVFKAGEDQSDYPQSYLSFEHEPREDQVLLVLVHLPVLERFEKQNAVG